MPALAAGSPFPEVTVPVLDGGPTAIGKPRAGKDWQLVVVYRGLHCPICKRYLSKLEELQGDFGALGTDVIALSGDPENKARAIVNELSLTMPMAYGLTVPQMRQLGLYVSDPRSPKETDQPFPEPGLFVVNDAGRVQIVDVSNAPFARPELEGIRNGIKFIRENDYPIRGTHQGE